MDDTGVCGRSQDCLLSHCGTERNQHIYGLYDSRVHDIFYVGSSFYPDRRFSDHVQKSKGLYTYKERWIQDILESGGYPLPLLLCTFQTSCDVYTRRIEHDIAQQLREQGHTALCDFYYRPVTVSKYREMMGKLYEPDPLPEMFSLTIEFLEMEHIDRITETARINRMLKEMYQYS